MKKLIILALSIVLFTIIFLWTACSKTDEEEGWSNDEQASYEELLSLQDEIGSNLGEWFLSMDSLNAINLAQQSFANASSVTEATINSKGIAVQYANGYEGWIVSKRQTI